MRDEFGLSENIIVTPDPNQPQQFTAGSRGTYVPVQRCDMGDDWQVSAALSPGDILDRCKVIGATKSHDYTTQGKLDGPGRFENFDRAEQIAGWFPSAVDKPYVVLIGVKLARLAVLLDSKTPNNESIEDTFVDLTNYCALWASRRSQR